jgi:hypothetical protein
VDDGVGFVCRVFFGSGLVVASVGWYWPRCKESCFNLLFILSVCVGIVALLWVFVGGWSIWVGRVVFSLWSVGVR